MKRTLGVLLASLAVTAAVAGCGDDDDGDGDGETLTKTEYLQRADAICVEINQRILELSEKEFLGEQGSFDDRAGVEEARALPAPEADEEQLETIYAAADQGVEQLRAGTESDEDPFQQFHDLAADYGFKKGCTENAR